jgi:hypothetical protein
MRRSTVPPFAFDNPDHVAVVIHNYRHNVPQEAPQAFAQAVLDAAAW